MKHEIKISNIFPLMGREGVYPGLKIFFSQDFAPKNIKCSEWPEMQKYT